MMIIHLSQTLHQLTKHPIVTSVTAFSQALEYRASGNVEHCSSTCLNRFHLALIDGPVMGGVCSLD